MSYQTNKTNLYCGGGCLHSRTVEVKAEITISERKLSLKGFFLWNR